MNSSIFNRHLDRRTLIKGAAALGTFQAASPFIIQARGETPIRMGMVDPLTGVYAAPAGNEVMGAKLAVEQMNAKGGILGRQVELLVEIRDLLRAQQGRGPGSDPSGPGTTVLPGQL